MVAADQPTSADESISGASGTGRRMPITVNRRPSTYTWMSGPAAPSPRRSAATDPSTVAGYLAVASLSQVPLASEPPTVSSRSSSTAWVPNPLVSAAGIRSDR